MSTSLRPLRRLVPLFGVALLLAAARGAAAQEPEVVVSDSLVELRRGGGARVVGRVVAVEDDQLTFETIEGERLQVSRRFARIRPARGRVVDGEFWPADRHVSRLFFAPTGRTLDAGAGYAGLFFVLPFVGYGATDDVTLAGGLPFAGSLETTPFWVAPKLRVRHTPRGQLSAGVFAMHVPQDETVLDCEVDCAAAGSGSSWAGVAYAVGTYGDDDNALHAGAGYAFGEGPGEFPIMVGGERRVSRRNKLITENWLIPGEGGAGSFGVRRLGDRWTIDYGMMFLFGPDATEVPYFPILSFSYAFGGGR